MAPLDAPSPTPSNLPGSGVKRPRPSAATSGAAGSSSRTKRRKAEEGTDADETGAGAGAGRGKNPVNFGVGMVKGREDEWGEPADVVTKIDFNTLPDETLYRYLELHDLLPRWDASPWSEKPCTPPNALYTLAPPPPAIPIVPEPVDRPAEVMDVDPAPPAVDAPVPPPVPPESGAANANSDPVPPSEGAAANANANATPDANNAGAAAGDEPAEGEEETPAPPTTRSKTAPQRKVSTPTPPPTPPAEIKRGVITLSDVHAARAALAEKANAHWVKGLGGGQNKEGETIVNFLYKMKAGPGRLLRVYNPHPPPFSY